jgi:II/X family phage/plasmid replication protein
MIDKLVLRCAFSDQLMLKIESLNIPMEASITAEGEVYDLRHAWERIPSSFAPMAFKVFDFRDSAKEGEAFVEIKASPAKLMQGHNVFGSDDIKLCALSLIELLAETYPLCFSELDQKTWEVVEVDITYFSRLKDQRETHQFINALQNVSSGQTKSRTGYCGTAYFGKKNSRLKSIKVYDKEGEVREYLKKLEKQGDTSDLLRFYTPELIDFTKGMVRWEVTLKKRWFERRHIPTKLTKLIHEFNPITYF